jgi:hypothetical protein
MPPARRAARRTTLDVLLDAGADPEVAVGVTPFPKFMAAIDPR